MRGLLVAIALLASCAAGRRFTASSLATKRGVAYYNPTDGGGSMLDNGTFYTRVPRTLMTIIRYVAGDGFGEPLNVSNTFECAVIHG